MRITSWFSVARYYSRPITVADRAFDFRNLVERTGNRAGKCRSWIRQAENHTGTHRTGIQHVRNIQQRTISRAAIALVHILTQLISSFHLFSGFFLSALFSRFTFLFSSRISSYLFPAARRDVIVTNWRISGPPHADGANFSLSRLDDPISTSGLARDRFCSNPLRFSTAPSR